MVKKGWAETEQNAEELWLPLFRKYNQTVKGLREGGFEIDEQEFWTDIRQGHEKYFTEDEHLREFLHSIPLDKYIFTNCNEIQAEHLLTTLGIDDCFSGIFGAKFMKEHCKPDKEAFEKVVAYLGKAPECMVLFEDSYKNLMTAKVF